MLFKRKHLLIIGLLLCLILGISTVSACDNCSDDTCEYCLGEGDSIYIDFLSTGLSQNENNMEGSLLGLSLDEETDTDTLSAYTSTREVGTGTGMYASINAALSNIPQNTEILVHAGTYTGSYNSGLSISTANIRIAAYVDPTTGIRDKVIIDGENSRVFFNIKVVLIISLLMVLNSREEVIVMVVHSTYRWYKHINRKLLYS